MQSKLPITLVMCVYNEEKNIGQALESVKNYVSQIVIVHDGPCKDRTGDIAREYNALFYETEKNKGSSEFIRIKSYEIATQKYILQLDADEYLTPDLQNILKEAVSTNADFITVNWAYFRNGKIVRTLVRRPYLFKKDKIYFIECPHESVHPKKDASTYHFNVDLINDAPDQYRNQKIIDKEQIVKQSKWIPSHARALVGFEDLKTYNIDSVNYKASLLNRLMASKAYRFHAFLTIPVLISGANFLSYLKMKRLRPFFFHKASYLAIKYYVGVALAIKHFRQQELH